MTESLANKSALHRLARAVFCVAAVITLVAVKCAASNVNFSFEWAPDREQGGHNLVLAFQPGSDATFDPSEPPADDDYNPEQDLEEQEKARQKPRGNDSPPNNGKSKPKTPSKGDSKNAPADASDTGGADGQWVLVVGTFTENDHEAAAKNMIRGLKQIAPEVTGLSVHTNTKGSLVVHGNYAGRDDPKAERDQKWLKGIKHQNRNVFNRVMLTHIDLRGEGQLHPYDLLSARRAHPKVNPLYTLDIALWDDFGAGKMKFDEIRKKAEAYAGQLRKQGHEAYFYHDEVNQRSIVTVGLFDRKAINAKSGLFSYEVEQAMKKFPVRQVNGEELHEFKDKYNPRLGTEPQTPKLVEVPAL
jgi:hypothetical protein